ncbi:NUDIX hydrolase [Aquabacterium sp.]|uniref:NUDIX hydrolase n=1 Tax=Aquabacterium sp. TaxID=1872578 RepID=UPI003D6CA1F0
MMTHIQQHSHELLSRYLRHFPGEWSRCQSLQEQLQADRDIFLRSNMAGHITSSAAVLSKNGQEILLIKHAFLGKWLTPGGHYEGPGDLFDSALREVEEETGVASATAHPWTIANQIPIDVDSHEVPARLAKSEGAHVHHDFLFVATAPVDAHLHAQLSEVHEVAWVPVGELAKSSDRRVQLLHRKLLSISASS